jgi:hypothetical protein
VRSDRGATAPGTPAPPRVPWQFWLRALLVVSGLVLLVIVADGGLVFYIGWSLVGLALLSEAAATIVHWRRSHGGSR